MSGWIKCSERMPPSGDFVIVSDGEIVSAGYVELGRWYVGIGNYDMGEGAITHWMPLPEIPVDSKNDL